MVEPPPTMKGRLAAAAVVLAAIVAVPALLRAPTPQWSHRREQWTDPITQMRFHLLPAGDFEIGTPETEHLRESQEVRHRVSLSRPVFIAETEVTQAQWTRIMGDNPSHFQNCGPGCPVERVTFEDVQRFIERLNRISDRRGFRLPTEAEWEAACRGHSSEPFGHLKTLSARDANINGNFPYQSHKGTYRKTPTPVGRFAPNWLGLYDMSGNVWEWVQDEYCPYDTTAVTDPIGSCGSDRKVIRGGSWAFDGGSARCGVRYSHRPGDRGYSLGFRLAREVQ